MANDRSTTTFILNPKSNQQLNEQEINVLLGAIQKIGNIKGIIFAMSDHSNAILIVSQLFKVFKDANYEVNDRSSSKNFSENGILNSGLSFTHNVFKGQPDEYITLNVNYIL